MRDICVIVLTYCCICYTATNSFTTFGRECMKYCCCIVRVGDASVESTEIFKWF